MQFDLPYVFTILFATLGPIRVIPGFAMIARDLDGGQARKLALRGALLASAIVAVTALLFGGTLGNWRISLPSLQIAGGILLFLQASQTLAAELGAIRAAASATAQPKPDGVPVGVRVLTPLAVPTIVTPIGLVAVLLFSGVAGGDPSRQAGLFGVLALILAMNLTGMLLAKSILRFVPLPVFAVAGWIMSALQAGLAVQAVLSALQNLGIIGLNP